MSGSEYSTERELRLLETINKLGDEKRVLGAMLDGTERASEKLKKENSSLREALECLAKYHHHDKTCLGCSAIFQPINGERSEG